MGTRFSELKDFSAEVAGLCPALRVGLLCLAFTGLLASAMPLRG
jgi:hypothetical protein